MTPEQKKSDPAAEKKIAAARTKLILDKPFLGTLVLRLPIVPGNPEWCQTVATDAKKLYFNIDYISALSTDQVQFVLAHEALHCALSHFARREHRNKRRWDVACDYAINPILIKDGLTPPPGTLQALAYEDMTAEEIYPNIKENSSDKPMDKHIYDQSGESNQPLPTDTPNDEDGQSSKNQTKNEEQNSGSTDAEPDKTSGGAAQPPPLTNAEQDSLEILWQQRLAGSAQQAIQSGKMSGALARMVEHLLQPRLPWRMLLAKYMTAIARNDYSYMRPSRRESSAIMPSLRSTQVNVVVALDTSGSISTGEIEAFLSEIDAIKGQMSAKITLHACDTQLAEDGPWTFEPWEEFVMPRQFKGGGGTDFRPVFSWLEQQTFMSDLLVYFTDGEGKFPPSAPSFSTLWLVKGKATVPFGQRIQLN
jgi:predicted metal-dependent peptidase